MKASLIILSVCFGSVAYAQSYFVPGSIVTLGGDTVRGFVSASKPKENLRQCIFRAEGNSDVVTYGPEQLTSYVINNVKAYVSLSRPSGTRTFFEVVLKSKGSALLFDGSLYFLLKGGLLMELGNSREEVTKDGKTFLLNKNEYKTVLLNQLRDCPSISPLIDRTGYYRKPLYRLFKTYYQCTNTKFSDPVDKKWSKLDLVLAGGASFSQFAFVHTEFKSYGAGAFEKVVSPHLALGFDLYSPKLNENVKLFTRLFFQAATYDGHFVNSQTLSRFEYDLTITTRTIKIPVGIKINVVKGVNPLYVAVGANFEPILKGECTVFSKEILQSSGVVFATENSLGGPFKKAMNGFLFAVGKELSLSRKMQFFTEARYEKMNGYMSTSNPSGSALSAVSLTAGLKLR